MIATFKTKADVDKLELPDQKWLRDAASEFDLSQDDLKSIAVEAREAYFAAMAHQRLNETDWDLVRQLEGFRKKLKRVQDGVKRYQDKAGVLLFEWQNLNAQDREFLDFFNRFRLGRKFGSIEENLAAFVAQVRLTQHIDDALEILASYHKERGADEGRPTGGESGIPWMPIVGVGLVLEDLWSANRGGKPFNPRRHDLGDDNPAFRLLVKVAQWIDKDHTEGDCRQAADYLAGIRTDGTENSA
jgi:hypothetical protein